MLKHTVLSLHTAMHKHTPDVHETLLMLYWYTALKNNNTAVTEYSQNGQHLMSSVQCISMQLGVDLYKIMSKGSVPCDSKRNCSRFTHATDRAILV